MDTNETNPNSSTQSSNNTNNTGKRQAADLTWKEKLGASLFLVALPAVGFAVGRWVAPSCSCPVPQHESAEAQMG